MSTVGQYAVNVPPTTFSAPQDLEYHILICTHDHCLLSYPPSLPRFLVVCTCHQLWLARWQLVLAGTDWCWWRTSTILCHLSPWTDSAVIPAAVPSCFVLLCLPGPGWRETWVVEVHGGMSELG